MAGFKITGKKGFHITFQNGYNVSVQFGPGNYCDNYDCDMGFTPDAYAKCGSNGSSTAECAVWGPDNEMIERPGWDDTVSKRSSPAEVLKLLNWAARQKR